MIKRKMTKLKEIEKPYQTYIELYKMLEYVKSNIDINKTCQNTKCKTCCLEEDYKGVKHCKVTDVFDSILEIQETLDIELTKKYSPKIKSIGDYFYADEKKVEALRKSIRSSIYIKKKL